MLPNMFVFSMLIAFTVAKLEVNTEGKYGWARHLPTWRKHNFISKLLFKDTPITGYHTWLNATLLLLMHFPFFLKVPRSGSLELQLIGMYLFTAVLEDLFWFALNPSFGLAKFNKKHVPWHRWIGPFPAMYVAFLLIGGFLLLLGSNLI